MRDRLAVCVGGEVESQRETGITEEIKGRKKYARVREPNCNGT